MEYVIAELIWEHKKSLSWQGLENAIKAANRVRLEQQHFNCNALPEGKPKAKKAKGAKAVGKKPPNDAPKPLKPTIDRRKLQDLAERKPNVPLCQHEFELLDTFFTRNGGPGLAEQPLFRRKEDLFQVLNKAEGVSFFVGVRFVEALGTEMIARWDISALNTMREHLPDNVSTESSVVATRDTGRPLEKKEWDTLLSQASGSIITSIGSPIACAPTERQMAGIFDIPAFKTRTSAAPVCFAHGNANPDFESAFVCDPDAVAGVKAGETALIVNGQAYVSRRKGAEYGIIIGQRTGHEHARFVVAGISGPGTLAAADFFANGQINVTLPRFSKKDKQPVLVAVISTDIRPADAPPDRRIDKRTVSNTRMVTRPLLFEHINREWVVTNE